MSAVPGCLSTPNLQKIGILSKEGKKPQVRLGKGERKSGSMIQHFGLPPTRIMFYKKQLIRNICRFGRKLGNTPYPTLPN